MAPKFRNIIIFVAIGAALVMIYIFFTRSSSDQPSLVSSSSNTSLPNVSGSTVDKNVSTQTTLVGKDFLALLLNVKTIKLDDSIFSDPSFISLHDSSIVLTPDGTEGRSNPFAQFGTESPTIPVNNTSNTNTTTPTNTPTSTTPPKNTTTPTNTPTSATPPKNTTSILPSKP